MTHCFAFGKRLLHDLARVRRRPTSTNISNIPKLHMITGSLQYTSLCFPPSHHRTRHSFPILCIPPFRSRPSPRTHWTRRAATAPPHPSLATGRRAVLGGRLLRRPTLVLRQLPLQLLHLAVGLVGPVLLHLVCGCHEAVSDPHEPPQAEEDEDPGHLGELLPGKVEGQLQRQGRRDDEEVQDVHERGQELAGSEEVDQGQQLHLEGDQDGDCGPD